MMTRQLLFFCNFIFSIQCYFIKNNKFSSICNHNFIKLRTGLYSSPNHEPIPSTNNCDTKSNPCGNESCVTISQNNSFIIKYDQPVSLEEIQNENIARIVRLECTDQQCNDLVWKCLGYLYNVNSQTFELSEKVFPKWAAKYPIPPDLIGVSRKYDVIEIDKPVRDASMNLMRSIPRDFKGGVRNLEPLGLFKGYKLNELTPNKTRRAQLVNWLIYYRERLFGKSIDQLREEAAASALAKQLAATSQETNLEQSEIDNLPSEKMYQKTRLDTL